MPVVLLEEYLFKGVNGVLNIHTDTVLEAVNEVGLQVRHGSVVRGAIVSRALGSQQLCHIAPLLRLSVDITHVVEESFIPNDKSILHLFLDLSCKSQSVVLKFISVKLHESLPKNGHGLFR
jgi:hypothetical protein